MDQCKHMSEVRNVAPHTRGCEECLKSGDEWVHLRLCMSCGHVGCCDSSKNKHATKHFHSSKHPVIKSFEPVAEWEGTCDTIHMWTQIVGKTRMAREPLINHWWNVTLYVTPVGLTTSPIP